MHADFCTTLNMHVDFIRPFDCINCIKMFGSGWAGESTRGKGKKGIEGRREVAWTPKIYDRTPPLVTSSGHHDLGWIQILADWAAASCHWSVQIIQVTIHVIRILYIHCRKQSNLLCAWYKLYIYYLLLISAVLATVILFVVFLVIKTVNVYWCDQVTA